MADALEWVFIFLFPNYNLGQGIANIYENSFLTDICEQLVPYCVLGPNPCCKGKILPLIFLCSIPSLYLQKEIVEHHVFSGQQIFSIGTSRALVDLSHSWQFNHLFPSHFSF